MRFSWPLACLLKKNNTLTTPAEAHKKRLQRKKTFALQSESSTTPNLDLLDHIPSRMSSFFFLFWRKKTKNNREAAFGRRNNLFFHFVAVSVRKPGGIWDLNTVSEYEDSRKNSRE
jgi:hypothetical protein